MSHRSLSLDVSPASSVAYLSMMCTFIVQPSGNRVLASRWKGVSDASRTGPSCGVVSGSISCGLPERRFWKIEWATPDGDEEFSMERQTNRPPLRGVGS
eukprot:COSAG02_NODE_51_length_44689_cov_29.477361_8_plen_99_part_00